MKNCTLPFGNWWRRIVHFSHNYLKTCIYLCYTKYVTRYKLLPYYMFGSIGTIAREEETIFFWTLWEVNCLCRKEWLWNFFLIVHVFFTLLKRLPGYDDWTGLKFQFSLWLEWHYTIWLYIGTYTGNCWSSFQGFSNFLRRRPVVFNFCACNHVFLS